MYRHKKTQVRRILALKYWFIGQSCDTISEILNVSSRTIEHDIASYKKQYKIPSRKALYFIIQKKYGVSLVDTLWFLDFYIREKQKNEN